MLLGCYVFSLLTQLVSSAWLLYFKCTKSFFWKWFMHTFIIENQVNSCFSNQDFWLFCTVCWVHGSCWFHSCCALVCLIWLSSSGASLLWMEDRYQWQQIMSFRKNLFDITRFLHVCCSVIFSKLKLSVRNVHSRVLLVTLKINQSLRTYMAIMLCFHILVNEIWNSLSFPVF